MCPFICNSVKQLNFEALQCAVLCLTKSLEWSIIFSLRHAPQLFRGGRTSSLTCKMFLCAQSTPIERKGVERQRPGALC